MVHTIMGKQVGDIGYGLMGLTWRTAPPPKEQAFAAMRASLANGCSFWNGGEFYGPPEYNSLNMLKEYYEKYPEDAEKVLLNIKGGARPNLMPDGSPEGVRRSVENSVKMLGPKGKIDMFECGRVDPNVPIKDTLTELDKLVKEGKIGGIALSEVNAKTIREASSITKIQAVEIEFSLFQVEPLTNGILEACAELNIPVIAYSPIGRGFLTGQFKSFDDLPEDSFLRHVPRFQPENFAKNLELVHSVEEIAKKKGCTPAQIAINWVVEIGKQKDMPTIVPIPGASHEDRVNENSKRVELSAHEMGEISSFLKGFEPAGTRYPEALMHLCDL